MDIYLESEGHMTTEVNERKVEISNSNRWRKNQYSGTTRITGQVGSFEESFLFQIRCIR